MSDKLTYYKSVSNCAVLVISFTLTLFHSFKSVNESKAKKRNKSVSRDVRALLFYGPKSCVAFFFFVIFV